MERTVNLNIQSLLQAGTIIVCLAFGYGVLEAQVDSNRADIAEVKANIRAKDVEFLKKFDDFLKEQKVMNAQIVENATTIKHIMASKPE